MTSPQADLTTLRVAHLIDSDGPGGAERVVAYLASNLQAAGAHNLVLLRDDGERWLTGQLRGSGVAVEYFQWDRAVSSACARSFAAAFRRHRIMVAHSHEFHMAVHGAWASRLAGVPHVITMHGGRYYAGRMARRIAMRAAIALSARTVAVSNQLADQMSRDLLVGRARIAMISNGVPWITPGRTTLREELGLAPCDRLLVSIGNLYPVKGHQHLIDALALLGARHAHVHVAIGGRGDLQESLGTQARAHGLASRVHLLGLRSDVPAMLASADAFVLPSLSEGLPLALLEAMFAACPIVASDVGEVGAVLERGEAGILVEPGNAAALASALDGLLNDPARARMLGDRARRRAAADYDVSHMVRRYVDAYDAITAPAPRPFAFRVRPARPTW